MLGLIYTALCLPLLGFILLISTSHYTTLRQTSLIGCSTVVCAFICFSIFLARYIYGEALPEDSTLFELIHLHKINAAFTLHFDTLTLLMSLIITGIGGLIHIYSIGYMADEVDHARYFAFMNFFIFAMLLLVLAGDLIVLFMGWEGVGLASYLLIGYWHERIPVAKAATKAFIMNRIGDFGLLFGILLTFYLFGTSNIAIILQKVRQIDDFSISMLTMLTCSYFFGSVGKSAQIPLYTWLPDAMEGPTPVSALIHAATMVTAGVYLVVRMHHLFILTPITLQIIGIIGASTALFAALCALAQTDLKRVLAYSTVSQLGFMFLACGAGAFYSAMFHLTTHAFVKSLLFLSAGNVVHMLHGATEMDKMGGLAKVLPKTNILFLVGVLALSGIPPLAAFFSKDLILEQEHLAGFNLLFYMALTASILTAMYLTRAYCLTFTGSLSNENTSLHEAPCVMLIPVIILALLAIFGGLLGYSFNHTPLLQNFLNTITLTPAEQDLNSGFVLTPESYMAIGGAIFAVSIVAWIYTRMRHMLSHPISILQHAFFVNEFYQLALVRPLKACAQFICSIVEPKIFDRSLQLITGIVNKIACVLQILQSGQIRSYAAWIVLGSIFLICYLVL